MPQIDFHIVKDPAPEAWLSYACRLVEKVYVMGRHIHIQTADAAMTDHMDDLLWIFRDRSFIPHQRTTDQNELCAVTLNHIELATDDTASGEVLVNLSQEIPKSYTKFERIVEIVGSDPNLVKAGRERFREYKNLGQEPKHHEIS